MKRHVVRIALMLAILSLAPVPASPDDPAPPFCTDVLTIPRKSLLLSWKLRNHPTLVLDGQRICTSDGPGPGSTGCDWEYELTDVAVLRPEAATVLRLVSTFRSHLTGSGAWLEFDALECQENRLVEVFSTGELLYGGRLRHLSQETLDVSRGVWLTQDAMCCPSHRRHTRYEWDKAGHTYVSEGETYFRVNSATRGLTKVAKPDDIQW